MIPNIYFSEFALIPCDLSIVWQTLTMNASTFGLSYNDITKHNSIESIELIELHLCHQTIFASIAHNMYCQTYSLNIGHSINLKQYQTEMCKGVRPKSPVVGNFGNPPVGFARTPHLPSEARRLIFLGFLRIKDKYIISLTPAPPSLRPIE